MPAAAMAAAFKNVEKTGEVGVEIGVRVSQRVAHAGLRGKMHDRAEIAVAKQRLGGSAVGEIEPVKGEVLNWRRIASRASLSAGS